MEREASAQLHVSTFLSRPFIHMFLCEPCLPPAERKTKHPNPAHMQVHASSQSAKRASSVPLSQSFPNAHRVRQCLLLLSIVDMYLVISRMLLHQKRRRGRRWLWVLVSKLYTFCATSRLLFCLPILPSFPRFALAACSITLKRFNIVLFFDFSFGLDRMYTRASRT